MFFGVTIFLAILSLVLNLAARGDYSFLLRLSIWTGALTLFCAGFLILQNTKWIRPTLAPILLAAYVLTDSILKISTGAGIFDWL